MMKTQLKAPRLTSVYTPTVICNWPRVTAIKNHSVNKAIWLCPLKVTDIHTLISYHMFREVYSDENTQLLTKLSKVKEGRVGGQKHRVNPERFYLVHSVKQLITQCKW